MLLASQFANITIRDLVPHFAMIDSASDVFYLVTYEVQAHWLTILICSVLIACQHFLRQFFRRRIKPLTEVRDETGDQQPIKYRFRKRDKVLFYSKKVLRKVSNLGTVSNGSSSSTSKMKRRERLLKIARRVLRMDKEIALRPTKRPPATFFEPDYGPFTDQDLPPEILYMLNNIRVFGHFEAPLFLELCKHVEIMRLSEGDTLFKPGDDDNSIYVVQSGSVTLYIKEHEEQFPVKIANKGDSIYSMLSILDVLTGHQSPFKTVSAVANVDSVVLRLCTAMFGEIFDKYHESWLRLVQIIVITLQRVIFTTLHTYLGLSPELTKPVGKDTQRSFGRECNPDKYASRHNRSLSICDESIDLSKARFTASNTSKAQSMDFDECPTDVAASSSPVTNRPKSSLQHQIEQTSPESSVISEMAAALGLDDDALSGKVKLQYSPPGHILCVQGSADVSLIYVLDGSLELIRSTDDDDGEFIMLIAQPREIVGGLALLTGEPSFYTIKSRQFSRTASINMHDFYQLMSEKPHVVLKLAHSVVQRLSPFVRSVDFALDLEMCDAGRALYNQAESADSMFVVLSGRLRSVLTKDDGCKELIEEYGRGDLVGMVELLTMKPRATTVISIRYTELAKIPDGLLNLIKCKYPQVLTRIIHLMGNCILGQHEQRLTASNLESLPRVTNLNTIAVMGVSENVPITSFTLELWHALNSMKPTLRLSSEVILKSLDLRAIDQISEYRLFTWLNQQEDAFPIVLYQCDFTLTSWTRRCIRQADCILIVANGEDEPSVGPVEMELENLAVRAQKELILLWSESVNHPRRTTEWLDVRGWVSSHYHLRMPHRMLVRRSITKMLEMYERVFLSPPDPFSDFSRLARILTGKAIGIVLGGGGARGAAHVGVLRALKEASIPIDIVGGVSIGAFIGGLYCVDCDLTHLVSRARRWFQEISAFWLKLFDLTYPASAMFTGSMFNNTLRNQFDTCQIEDLWIPYFNITTDITSSEMRIHRNGSIWRYCRASMTMAGYFPPICDPLDGHLLLDGGYTNNLPADVMRGMGVNTVIAVDVGAQDETDLTNYGDSLSGWWVLWKRWMPFTKPVRVLNMAEIQSRLAYVSCVRQLEIVKKAPYCFYVRPPIDKHQTLDFPKFDEICQLGYEYGKTLFDVWTKSGKFDEILGAAVQTSASWTTMSPPLRRRSSAGSEKLGTGSKFMLTGQISTSSFTDLAALVSKIRRPSKTYYLSDVSEEVSAAESDEESDRTDQDTLIDLTSDQKSNERLSIRKRPVFHSMPLRVHFDRASLQGDYSMPGPEKEAEQSRISRSF